MGTFLQDLLVAPRAQVEPVYRNLKPRAPRTEPEILKPTYGYEIDWDAVEAARPEELRRLDDAMREKQRQFMAQLIPGVQYELGRTDTIQSNTIWARPVRVHPWAAPAVKAWADFLTAAVNQP